MAAPGWKRILKGSACLLGRALALPVVAYVVLLLINWRDQPPTESALAGDDEIRALAWRPASAGSTRSNIKAASSQTLAYNSSRQGRPEQ